MKPTDSWGPANAVDRTGKYAATATLAKDDAICVAKNDGTSIGQQPDDIFIHSDTIPSPRYQCTVLGADNEAFDGDEPLDCEKTNPDVIAVTSFRTDA